MRKVIGGKVYDSETAEEVGSYDNGMGTRDFNHYNETLYKTKNGRYFLCGSGGAASHYAKQCGSNTTCGGSRLIPHSEEDALRWCENNNVAVEEIETHFGKQEEA